MRIIVSLLLCVSVLLSVGAARLEAETGQPGRGLIHFDRPAPPLQQDTSEIPDWLAWLELARLQSYVQQYDDSLASYDRVLKDQPDHLQARLERAKVLTWAGRQQEALADLQAIPEDRLDADARLILGDLHAARQEYDKAMAIFENHLATKPHDYATRLKLAEILSWDQRYEASLEQYAILLEALPGDVQLRRKYAFVLSWAGRHDDAIRELRQTLP